MSFISYAQNFEDVQLWRALRHVDAGFYIDVGANDPEDDSVTKAFYDRGWHGINIEPLPEHHAHLCAQRPRDINLALAAGASDGELALFDIPSVRGWASPNAEVADKHRKDGFDVRQLTVPVRTLAQICEEYADGEIHFLKIDVEGFEAEVIRGMDFRRWRPWIVVAEATRPNSQDTNHESWEPALLAHAYRFVYFDGLNRYYIAAEHAELAPMLATPPNVFDDFLTIGQLRALESARLAEHRAQQAEQQLAAAVQEMAAQRISELKIAEERNLREALTRAQAAEARVQTAELSLQAMESDAKEARVRALEAQTQAEEAWSRAREMEAQWQSARDEAGALRAQLQDVYASTSWKVSAPVRLLGSVLLHARQAQASPRTFARTAAASLLRRVKPLVKRSPLLMHWAMRLHARFPNLTGRALRLAAAPMPPTQEATQDAVLAAVALSDTPSAWGNQAPASRFKALLHEELQRHDGSGG